MGSDAEFLKENSASLIAGGQFLRGQRLHIGLPDPLAD